MTIGPCPEASDAVTSLMQSRRSNEAIVVVCPASGTFDWYAKQAGIESKAFDPPEFDSESSRSEFGSSTNSIIVGVVNDGQFNQSVTSVLDAQSSTRPWIGGVEELLWQGKTLALYRVWIGLGPKPNIPMARGIYFDMSLFPNGQRCRCQCLWLPINNAFGENTIELAQRQNSQARKSLQK